MNSASFLTLQLRCGVVQLWDILSSTPTHRFQGTKGRVVGMHVSHTAGARHLHTCTETGSVSVYNWLEETPTLSFSVGGSISRMRWQESVLAFGGKERDLNVWDLETQKSIFKAKNVPHDFLDVRVPVWVTDLRFYNQRPSTADGGNPGSVIVTGTGYSQVLFSIHFSTFCSQMMKGYLLIFTRKANLRSQ